MKKLLLTTVAAAGVWSMLAPIANAADIIEPPAYIPPPPPPVVEVQTSGWYLRGDVGYNFRSKTDGHYDFYNVGFGNNGVDTTEHYDEIMLKGNANFGVGVGYQVNDYFRTDLTLDYFRTDVEGNSKCSYLTEIGYGLDPVNNNCRYDDSADASVWTAMANAYVDIGTYGGITPYIGAGLGFAHVKYDDVNGEITCGGGLCGSETEIYSASRPGESSWRFASSLMAGASMDLTDNLKLDAGYKYTRISKGDVAGYDAFDSAAGATGTQTRDHGFNIHTVRAGLRYQFGGAGFGKGKGKAPAPLYAAEDTVYAEPAPVYEEPVYYK